MMATVKTNPHSIDGPWIEGFTLDEHVVSSVFLGYDDYDHPRFDTERTALGECVYRLKYRGGSAGTIVETAVAFVRGHWPGRLDCVIAPPPSVSRTKQPALVIAGGIADDLGLPFKPRAVTKAIPTSPMKNVTSPQDRRAILEAAIQAGSEGVRGMRVLLVDDLWDTGSTLRRVATVMAEMGAAEIRALAMTRTR